ncbi:peroxide stress protein YaaA [Leucobacter ruminantium]|uniref:Peroxide stress protein YaaA n=1 Tax=Leucobacter ruminantium TaxID=1289170 RepID=A0A939LSE4_9MICO|nr:peroxide stress protein YaaA [Leucobacter ruminantium]
MLLLLPPSETKRVGGEGSLAPNKLRAHGALAEARERVRTALVELSSGEEDAAAKALKLGVKNRGELAHNLELETSGTMAAIERYTGVLYDALDVGTLTSEARAWLDEHAAVQSALFGLVAAGDPIPAYRLSAGSRLPGLGAPLKRIWSEAHSALEWDGDAFVLDLRSQDYAALAPLPDGVGWFLHVVQRGKDGRTRALNHFNKAAKGDLVRRLARSLANISDPAGLLAWARSEGLEMDCDEDARTITLVTDLGAPAAAADSA